MNFTKILLVFLGCIFFLFGQQSFITSSEFWSIYSSQNYLLFNNEWSSLFMKPIFNFILFLFYLVPLTDAMHIHLVKALFAANGVLQFGLLFLIFKKITNNDQIKSFLLTLLIALSPFYFTHYFRVRSDQLALTIFLFFIYSNLAFYKFRSAWNLLIIILFPLIGLKHIYFSIIAFSLLDFKKTFSFVLGSSKYEKFYLFLLFLGIGIWTTNLAIQSFDYFLASYDSFKSSSRELLVLFYSEFVLIIISTFCFIDSKYRTYLRNNNLHRLVFVQILILLVILIHPQKYNFFIASLTPVFYLPGAIYLLYLSNNKFNRLSYLNFIFIILLTTSSLFLGSQTTPLLTRDRQQIETITKISNLVQVYKMNYLDGMGSLPRQKNTGCFVSPDDFTANQFCLNSLKKGIPDSIILTNRLMALKIEASSLNALGYVEIGPNFYVKKKFLKENEKLANSYSWPPPALIFGSFYIY